jgi:hypothetical protein
LHSLSTGALSSSEDSKIIDFFEARPRSKFADEVATLQSLGLDESNPEHAFFLSCYMRFPTDISCAQNGEIDNSLGVSSLPVGGSFTPRASVLKKIPKEFRNKFLSQQSSKTCSRISNSSLTLQPGGGLESSQRLPKEVHALMVRFMHGNFYKNTNVALISLFLVHIQNGLTELDEVLLKYTSPVYKACPFKLKVYKNEKKEVKKNKDHPAYEKWDALISRTHFDEAYATTRITFPWKGFYMPKGKISSLRDKYAFFAFVYSTDHILGALPLWPLQHSSQFQLDRRDPLRHYTIDNVRWLGRSDNMASKPSNGRGKGNMFQSTKDVKRLLSACEKTNTITLEILAALSKGYGSQQI